ncbi:MAG: glycosyltransferase family 4 protein [Thermoleophilia bacterium]
MIRVVHLSVVHPANEPRIYERECRTLAEGGYDVTYLVPGAVPGRDEHGVRLMPLPRRPRSRRWLSVREIVSALRDVRPHVVHIHDPELLTLFPILRAWVPRLVYDMHDYVPEQVLAKDYIPSQARPFIAQTSRVAQRALAALGQGAVGAFPDMLTALGARPRLRVTAPNYPRVSRFEAAEPVAELAADPRLRLVYIGSLSTTRGCTLMIDVMARLGRDDAVLILGGSFASPELEADVRARLSSGLDDRVHLLGRVPPPELPRYLAAAEVVWMPSLPSVQYSRPNVETKIYEGMAVGLATLASDLAGREEFLQREACGIAVPPTVDGHVAGVQRLLADRAEVARMGARGFEAVRKRYSWESAEGRLLGFYEELCRGLPAG